MRSVWRTSAILIVLWLSPGQAQERPLIGVALVIGEDTYENLPVLANPANDARAMDDLLSSLGFDVTRVLNRGADRLRDAIADFEEDARSANVALVYYSGHGVEVGGSNFLVPIDADIDTPDAAGESLIALDDLVDRLDAVTPVTIVLLDACRSEAFPPGTLVQLPGTEEAVAALSTGLAHVELRGPKAVAKPGGNATTLGMAIGFAAQPGSPAYDGVDGSGHSPYAAALLKHFAAGGYSFGDLMTLVTEEVYLKTGNKQLPSTVSSLLGVLTFGEPPAAADPDEAAIANGRRILLLNIARTPSDLRQQVEAVAVEAAVPMDALYGLLQSLGQDLPADPAELDRLLVQQTQTIRKLMEERTALASSDIEILRLSDLAQRALDEGLLNENLEYRRAAEARWEAIRPDVLSTATQAKERLVEGVATVALTADALSLTGDYLAAASKYGEAFDQIVGWDDTTARTYKWRQANALEVHGDRKGDNAALADSIAAYGVALQLTLRDREPQVWGNLQNDLGVSLAALGQRDGETDTLEAAAAAYRASLEVRPRERAPLDWAQAQNNLGVVFEKLGDRGLGREYRRTNYEAAVDAYRLALEERTRERDPYGWATTQNNLGNALEHLGEIDDDMARLEESVSVYEAALEELTRDSKPLDWAMVQANLGIALTEIGRREDGTDTVLAGIDAYRAALEERTRERVPLEWAATQNNLGVALELLGDREDGTGSFELAVVAYRAALEERTQDRSPLQWATTQSNLGQTLLRMGKREEGTESLFAAATAFRAALDEWTRERDPFDWGDAHFWLAETEQRLGERISGPEGEAHWVAAIEYWTRAAQIFDRNIDPKFFGRLLNYAGFQLVLLGERESGNDERYAAAIPLLRESAALQAEQIPDDLPYTLDSLGRALLNLGRSRSDQAMLLEAQSVLKSALVGKELDPVFVGTAGLLADTEAALAALD